MNSTQSRTVELPVHGWAFIIGAGGLRVSHLDLLHILHHKVKVKVTGQTYRELLNILIDENLLNIPSPLIQDLYMEIWSSTDSHNEFQATEESVK